MISDEEVDRLSELSRTIRKNIIQISGATGSGHVGSSLSVVDLLVYLYECILKGTPDDPERDRLIFSKGHAGAALYTILSHKGILPQELFSNFAINGTMLGHHPHYEPEIGLEANTGSLGHGLSIGCGLAFGARMDRSSSNTFVVMSDGECNEGSVWEAASFAGHHQLNNLCMVLDANKMQAMGNTSKILNPIDHARKWHAFGWETAEVDGHDFKELSKAFLKFGTINKPYAIIAHTVKGKGISFMENSLLWHYRPPQGEEYRAAMEELDSCE